MRPAALAALVVAALAATALPGDDAPRAAAREALAIGAELTSDVLVTPLGAADEETGVPLVSVGVAQGGTQGGAQGGDAAKPLVVLFWSTRCPVCRRYDAVLKALAKDYDGRARIVLAFPNATESAADVRAWYDGANVPLPVTIDRSRAAASRLGAAVTPTAVLLDAGGVLRYRGPIDDDRRARHRDTTDHLRVALDSVLTGKPVENPEPRAFGSSVRVRRTERR